MKTKHYIYIAIGLLLAVIIGVPAYYYCKGYTISEDPYAGGTKQTQFAIKPTIADKNRTSFFSYALLFWTKIATKTRFWELEEPKKLNPDDIIIFT